MYRLLRRRMDPVAELTSRQSASHRFVQLNALRVLDTAVARDTGGIFPVTGDLRFRPGFCLNFR
jgi:hypothetical protein